MAPNAHGLFKKLGIDLAETGANEVEWVSHICTPRCDLQLICCQPQIHEVAPTAKINRELPVGKFNQIWQHVSKKGVSAISYLTGTRNGCLHIGYVFTTR